MTYKLFLDDERFPPRDGEDWVIARSSDEAAKIVGHRGIPRHIAFDHDLAGDDIAMNFAHWLVDYCLDNNLSLKGMTFYAHSQNPRGAENITCLIKNFQEKGN